MAQQEEQEGKEAGGMEEQIFAEEWSNECWRGKGEIGKSGVERERVEGSGKSTE